MNKTDLQAQEEKVKVLEGKLADFKLVHEKKDLETGRIKGIKIEELRKKKTELLDAPVHKVCGPNSFFDGFTFLTFDEKELMKVMKLEFTILSIKDREFLKQVVCLVLSKIQDKIKETDEYKILDEEEKVLSASKEYQDYLYYQISLYALEHDVEHAKFLLNVIKKDIENDVDVKEEAKKMDYIKRVLNVIGEDELKRLGFD